MRSFQTRASKPSVSEASLRPPGISLTSASASSLDPMIDSARAICCLTGTASSKLRPPMIPSAISIASRCRPSLFACLSNFSVSPGSSMKMPREFTQRARKLWISAFGFDTEIRLGNRQPRTNQPDSPPKSPKLSEPKMIAGGCGGPFSLPPATDCYLPEIPGNFPFEV